MILLVPRHVCTEKFGRLSGISAFFQEGNAMKEVIKTKQHIWEARNNPNYVPKDPSMDKCLGPSIKVGFQQTEFKGG